MAQWLTNLLGTMWLQVQSLALLSGLRIWCCHELWLWCRMAATAPIRPLGWNFYMPWCGPKKQKRKEGRQA